MSLKKSAAFCFVFLCQNISAQNCCTTNLKGVVSGSVFKKSSIIQFAQQLYYSIISKNQSSLASFIETKFQETIVVWNKINNPFNLNSIALIKLQEGKNYFL